MEALIPFKNKQEIVEFCQKHDVSYLGLFGSHARNEMTETSDIDLLFDFREGVRKSLFDIGGMVIELEEKFGKEVDLVQRNAIKPRLKPYILNELTTLYEER